MEPKDVIEQTKSHADSLPLASVLARLDEEFRPKQNNRSRNSESILDGIDDESIFDNDTHCTTTSTPLATAPTPKSKESQGVHTTNGGRHRSASVSTTISPHKKLTLKRHQTSPKHRSASAGKKTTKDKVEDAVEDAAEDPAEDPAEDEMEEKKTTALSPVQKAAAKWRRKTKFKRRSSLSNLEKKTPDVDYNLDAHSASRLGQRRRMSLSRINVNTTAHPDSPHLPQQSNSPHSPHSPHAPHSPHSPILTKGSPMASPTSGMPKTSTWRNQLDSKDIIKIARESKVLTSDGSLSESKLMSLIKASEVRTYKRGMFLCHQGEVGDGMYIVISGDILILRIDQGNGDCDDDGEDDNDNDNDNGDDDKIKTVDPMVPAGYRKVAEISKGGSFGETSLLKNVPRNASACVKTHEAVVLMISRALFAKLRKWGVLDLSSQLNRSSTRSKLYDVLQSCPCLSELSQDMILDLVDKGSKKTFPKNTYVFHEGEVGNGLHISRSLSTHDSSAVYLLLQIRNLCQQTHIFLVFFFFSCFFFQHTVLSGKVVIIKMSEQDRKLDKEEAKHDKNILDTRKRIANRRYFGATTLCTMTSGDLFGEQALLTKQPRTAAAKASNTSKLTTLFISSKLYRQISKRSGGALETEIVRAKIDVLQSGFLDRTPPFHRLSHRLKTKLVETMRLVRFEDQQYICKQGTIASRMYFIVKGRVRVTIQNTGERKPTEITKLYCKFSLFIVHTQIQTHTRLLTLVYSSVVCLCFFTNSQPFFW